LSNNFPIQSIQRGEQSRCPVTLVVVSHSFRPSPLHRQSWLSAVKSLDLALFVNAEYQCVFRRVEVQSDDIMELLNETRVAAQLERTNQVGLQTVLLPDTLYGGGTQTYGGRQAPRAPVRGLKGLLLQSLFHNLSHPVFLNPLLAPRPTPVFKQTRYPAGGLVAIAPAGNRRSGRPKLAYNLTRSYTIGTHQRNTSSPHYLLRCIPVSCHSFQSDPIDITHKQSFAGSHDQYYNITNVI